MGDDWKVSDRLTLNFGTRYTLNFPSTEVNNQGAVFNLNTQVLDFPHTARDLECCDFGPRAGLAYRLGDHWVVRAGYGMVWFEQTGITTPFTLPQFPFVQTVGQQSQDNINAAFISRNGPTVQVPAPNPNSGLGTGRIRRAAGQRLRLLAAMELHGAENLWRELELRGRLSGFEEHAARYCRKRTSTSCLRQIWRWARRC